MWQRTVFCFGTRLWRNVGLQFRSVVKKVVLESNENPAHDLLVFGHTVFAESIQTLIVHWDGGADCFCKTDTPLFGSPSVQIVTYPMFCCIDVLLSPTQQLLSNGTRYSKFQDNVSITLQLQLTERCSSCHVSQIRSIAGVSILYVHVHYFGVCS